MCYTLATDPAVFSEEILGKGKNVSRGVTGGRGGDV